MRDACGKRFTAAVLRVAAPRRSVFEAAYGYLDDTPGARPAHPGTRFDLASLTKLFVATLALGAVARGKLTLDGELTPFIPEWEGTGHAAITLRQLLAHTSGMLSGADYRTLFGVDVERFALTLPLVAVPGERVIYSDLGFIALGALLSRVYEFALGLGGQAFLPVRRLPGIQAARRGSLRCSGDRVATTGADACAGRSTTKKRP